VPEAGWAGISNGVRNLTHQQNLLEIRIGVVVLVAISNEFEVLRPLMPTSPLLVS
jgi:hypothetical protein